MPDNRDMDDIGEIDKSLRLQGRLRIQAITGILVTAMVVGGIASFRFYQSRQQSVIDQLQKELQFAALALGAKLNEYKSVALQVTSRTRARQLLQSYNRGEIELAQLMAETRPKLVDAMRLSPEIIGITRLDRRHVPIARVGDSLTQSAWPAEYRSARIAMGIPVSWKEHRVVAVSAAILTLDGEREGTDLVYFNIDKSIEILAQLSARFSYNNRVLLAAVRDGQPHFFKLGKTLENSEIPVAESLLQQHLIDGLVNHMHRVRNAHNIEQLMSHVKTPYSNWQLIFVADARHVMQAVRSDTWYLFATIMLLMIAGIFITNRLIKPTVGKILVGSQTMRELSARNQQLLEQTLRNKRLLEDILNHTPAVVFIKDLEGRYIHVNQNYADERGLPVEEIIGKSDRDLHPPEIAEMFRVNDRKAIETDSPVIIEEQFEIAARMHTFITTKFPLKDVDGETYAMCGIGTDVTDIKQSEELKYALEVAESANQAKSIFLANMSHELRTPLHGILSYSELGRERIDSVSKEKLSQYFENIRISGKRLLNLLNDLLDLSKLEAGKFELVYKNADLVQILNDCIEEQSPGIDEKSLKVVTTKGDIDTRIDCDRERIFQVFRNLLSNAIKFSHKQGVIEISMENCELKLNTKVVDAIEVRLLDDGGGIEQADLEQIFDKFTQSKNTHSGGTGLGLSISREIVLLHQGEIWAENSASGGAVLVTRLPREKPPDIV